MSHVWGEKKTVAWRSCQLWVKIVIKLLTRKDENVKCNKRHVTARLFSLVLLTLNSLVHQFCEDLLTPTLLGNTYCFHARQIENRPWFWHWAPHCLCDKSFNPWAEFVGGLPSSALPFLSCLWFTDCYYNQMGVHYGAICCSLRPKPKTHIKNHWFVRRFQNVLCCIFFVKGS